LATITTQQRLSIMLRQPVAQQMTYKRRSTSITENFSKISHKLSKNTLPLATHKPNSRQWTKFLLH